MVKKTILTAFLALLWNTTALANDEFPSACPSVSDIQSVMPSIAIENEDLPGSYATLAVSHYNTELKWNFIISEIQADSNDDALQKSIESMTTLSGNPEPIYLDDMCFCIYTIGHGYIAAAFEPGIFATRTAIKLARQHTL